MQKSIGFFLSVIFCFSLHANQAEVLKKLAEETPKSEQKERTYEGNSLVYNIYDSTLNGIKGGIFAGIAIPCTMFLYTPYSIYKLGDLVIKKLKLCTSNAEQLDGKYRKYLEKETTLRELTNRGAKAVFSVVVAWNLLGNKITADDYRKQLMGTGFTFLETNKRKASKK